jgi:hypothetical protein
MAIAPDVHVGGKLETIASLAPSSKVEYGSVVVALRGYGSFVPQVANEAVFARVSTEPIEMNVGGTADGSWAVFLYNNKLIQPAGTYYTFTFRDSNGDVVQTTAVQFSTGGDYSFGNLPPFDPTQPPPPLPPQLSNNWIWVPSTQPVFDGSTITTFGLELFTDVNASTFINGFPGTLYTFFIVQDPTGGRRYTWPPNILNASPAPSGALQILVQTFVADATGATLYPIGPGTYFQQ